MIDSGLARIPADSPWTGLPSLHVGRISKASANQRAGQGGTNTGGPRDSALSRRKISIAVPNRHRRRFCGAN